MMSIKELKAKTKADMKDNWHTAASLTLMRTLIVWSLNMIVLIILMVFNVKNNTLLFLFIINFIVYYFQIVFSVGYYSYFLKLSRGKFAPVDELFSKFSYFKVATLTCLLHLFRTTIMMILFIVPGFIMGLDYSLFYFVMLDYQDLSPSQILAKSKRMMKGHRIDELKLFCGLIPMLLIDIVTVGIGTFWTSPYCNCCLANFYENVKNDYESKFKEEKA